MRRRARLDDNHASIVKAVRLAGASVQSLAELGSGAPDIAVGFEGLNFFFEIKDPSKPPSARKLTTEEAQWHNLWAGQVAVVYYAQEVLDAIGLELPPVQEPDSARAGGHQVDLHPVCAPGKPRKTVPGRQAKINPATQGNSGRL